MSGLVFDILTLLMAARCFPAEPEQIASTVTSGKHALLKYAPIGCRQSTSLSRIPSLTTTPPDLLYTGSTICPAALIHLSLSRAIWRPLAPLLVSRGIPPSLDLAHPPVRTSIMPEDHPPRSPCSDISPEALEDRWEYLLMDTPLFRLEHRRARPRIPRNLSMVQLDYPFRSRGKAPAASLCHRHLWAPLLWLDH